MTSPIDGVIGQIFVEEGKEVDLTPDSQICEVIGAEGDSVISDSTKLKPKSSTVKQEVELVT